MKHLKDLVIGCVCLLSFAGVTLAAPGDDAEFVQASVAEALTPGGRATATVAFRNIGTTTWAKTAGYRLGAQNPSDNFTWGTNRVELTADVAPKGVATFTFEVTAPKAAGVHNFQWRMLREGVAWFGTLSPNVAIDVK
jgi:hypothetical protein